MQIIVVAVVLVALIAWIVVKNDEMSGLGRNVKAGTLRHPHGKLVRAKATTVIPEEAPLANRIKRSMPFISSVAIIAVCVVLYVCDFTVLGHSSSQLLATLSSTGIVALIIAAEATLRAPEAARYVLDVCLRPCCRSYMRPRCVGVHCNGRLFVV